MTNAESLCGLCGKALDPGRAMALSGGQLVHLRCYVKLLQPKAVPEQEGVGTTANRHRG